MKQKVFLLVLALFTITQIWAQDFEIDGICYHVTSSAVRTVEIKSCTNESIEEHGDSVIIPSSVVYNGVTYSVTKVGNSAFSSCSALVSISMPKGITSIGDSAFKGCTGLIWISIPDSVTFIGSSAFCGCSGLTSISLPNSIGSIEDSSFRNCSGLTSIAIPDSVAYIHRYAFEGCSGLTSVTITKKVKEIGDYAFGNCKGLTSVVFKSYFTDIKDYTAFYGCSNVKELIYAESCSCAFKTYLSSINSVIISDGVTSIGVAAFTGFNNLTNVSFPRSVRYIEDFAFQNCSRLKKVKLNEGLKDIGNMTFRGCSNLHDIVIPSTVNYIRSEAFSSVTKAFFLTDTKPSMGNKPFSNCKIYYTKNNTSYGIPGFQNVYPLINSMFEIDEMTYIPTSMSEKTCDFVEGRFTKDGCIPSIAISGNDAYRVTRLGDYAFYGSQTLSNVTIPNSIASRGQYAFNECPNINSVTVTCEDLEDFAKYVSRSNVYDVFYAGILEKKKHSH